MEKFEGEIVLRFISEALFSLEKFQFEIKQAFKQTLK